MLPSDPLRNSGQPESTDEPVTIRGIHHREDKRYLAGTHRTRPPESTLDLIRPYLARIGVTRLANVTHLDRLGIPVVLSIRPGGRFLGADAGKGCDLPAAKVSAGMEAIERWRAETGDFCDFRCSIKQVVERGAHVPPEKLAVLPHGGLSSDWAYGWSLGWDLRKQENVAVPAMAVGLPGTESVLRELGMVVWESGGLASGNTLLEAVESALLELIERDAVACVQWAMRKSRFLPPLVTLDSVEDGFALDLLSRLKSRGVAVTVADCTTDVGIPTYWAVFRDLQEPTMGLFGGYGSHPDPTVALLRALNEAAQSRLIYISGSRDDIFKRDYAQIGRDQSRIGPHPVEQGNRRVDLPGVEGKSHRTFNGDINEILDRLESVGLHQVVVREISDPSIPVAIVRAIIPGLESYRLSSSRPGPRARAFVEAAA